jgi:Arc/MetJ-type ribon-helix-helix transcriptional regulator
VIIIAINVHIIKFLGEIMRTIQMTLDDQLVNLIDDLVAKTGTTRSAFTREALRAALKRAQLNEMEEKHRQGYERHPATPSEFSIWEDEQEWGDA